jgi:hypothetical protein
MKAAHNHTPGSKPHTRWLSFTAPLYQRIRFPFQVKPQKTRLLGGLTGIAQSAPVHAELVKEQISWIANSALWFDFKATLPPGAFVRDANGRH